VGEIEEHRTYEEREGVPWPLAGRLVVPLFEKTMVVVVVVKEKMRKKRKMVMVLYRS
jgi:hypothetical protein